LKVKQSTGEFCSCRNSYYTFCCCRNSSCSFTILVMQKMPLLSAGEN